MKRIFILLLLAVAFCHNVAAQDIYNEVRRLMDNYQKERFDASKGLEERKIATFKYDAIRYLLSKAGDETENELGEQVAAMIDFVNLYLAQLKDAKKNQQQTLMAKYKNASLENSLYNDTDKELIYAYVDNTDFLTQFSLDTDWVKALQAVSR